MNSVLWLVRGKTAKLLQLCVWFEMEFSEEACAHRHTRERSASTPSTRLTQACHSLHKHTLPAPNTPSSLESGDVWTASCRKCFAPTGTQNEARQLPGKSLSALPRAVYTPTDIKHWAAAAAFSDTEKISHKLTNFIPQLIDSHSQTLFNYFAYSIYLVIQHLTVWQLAWSFTSYSTYVCYTFPLQQVAR